MEITKLLADSFNQVENSFKPQSFLILEYYLQKRGTVLSKKLEDSDPKEHFLGNLTDVNFVRLLCPIILQCLKNSLHQILIYNFP